MASEEAWNRQFTGRKLRDVFWVVLEASRIAVGEGSGIPRHQLAGDPTLIKKVQRRYSI
jgi:hypothetical protein